MMYVGGHGRAWSDDRNIVYISFDGPNNFIYRILRHLGITTFSSGVSVRPEALKHGNRTLYLIAMS